jgi:anti-sigma factor RsiW
MPSSGGPTEQLRAHFRRERNAMDGHPPPERIAAYHEQRLSPDDMEEMRSHLGACPACTAELLELAALFDAEGDPGADVSRTELDAAWQRQQASLGAGPSVARLEERRGGAPLRQPWAMAALSLAAALLAVIALAQWRVITQLRQPQVNPPLVNLVPTGSLREGTEAIPELQASADAPRVWVILNPAVELEASAYDVEVVAPDGRVVLHFEDIQESEAANFRVEIPRDLLREGTHRILLIRENAGDRQVIEEFDLRVRLSSSPAP